MKDGESVTNYCARTMEISNKMRFHSEKMGDVTIVEKILRSLTAKYDYVVCLIEESKDIDALSLDELQSSLLVHEQKMNRSSTIEEQALKASTSIHFSNSKGRGKGRGRGRGRGDQGNRDGSKHFKADNDQFQGKGRGHDQYFDKSKVECFRCHKFGHYRSECYTKLPNDKEKGEKSNFAEKKEVETLLMAAQVDKELETDVWYVDTGCSNHMCGSKSSFSYLNEDFHSTVSFGDCSTVNVMGNGDIQIRTKNGFAETISNVLYVPNLKSNLLSAGQLQEKGYVITIQQGACEIYDPTRGAIAVVQMGSNRLFPLKIDSIRSCLMAEVKDPSWLWHFCYGHLSFGGLKTLQQKNMVTGLSQITIPSQVCEECVVGKQHRSQFPQGKSWRAKTVLELVHSDICGPINPSSNGGKRYLITFIDDYTRKTWVYFLQEKSQAFSTFKSFKARVENETGRTIKTLRTDRGGEYCSKEFENFCEAHGIRRELTTAYTPQQNGVSERKNRTILNMVRSLLTRGRIPKTFWPEAVNWSIHILNRSPTFAVQNMTPEEAWSGRKPAVDHFKIFGYIAYAHVPNEKRKKLDDKGEKCIFLGVSEVSKAYKLLNPLTKKIVTSRDVVFDEESSWDWNRQQPTPVIFDSDAEEKSQPNTTTSMPETSSNTIPTVAEILPTTVEATGGLIYKSNGENLLFSGTMLNYFLASS
ncbi:Retrovirus-related Pol polyprotein from transposon TNT 1-94 [Quillaja saponaria]|uniref:Retrovirus-related Pol polyprotein from transposon TNT 1-94 n=1 Tax=Quillaja saponaria TaxID=32244 RepID=A0AAD7VM03_QUISA|nr:Retrovirus-related Pol polyprotein from transposon TNT 1-94 [Quillaja saponaria]